MCGVDVRRGWRQKWCDWMGGSGMCGSGMCDVVWGAWVRGVRGCGVTRMGGEDEVAKMRWRGCGAASDVI